MTGPPPSDGDRRLGPPIAATLRYGTIGAVAAIGIGFALALIAGDLGPGPTSVVELLSRGGPDALIGAGLLVMTLIPAAVLVVAAIGFLAAGEWVRAVTTIAVLALLIASLVAAAVIGGGAPSV